MRTRSGKRLRNAPVVGYVAAAAALAVLLPSGLTLPNSGPPTVAEYAPVPGQSNGNANESRLGAASSNGLGSGLGSGAAQPSASPSVAPGAVPPPPLPPPPNRALTVGNTMRCVLIQGVWHQTEDPLSPPCVTYFPGNNGGPTGAPGVTGKDIVVVMRVTYGGASYPGPAHITDCNQALNPNSDNLDDDLCKGFIKYFNTRYFLYGRTVHLYADHGVSLPDVVERLHPFAFVNPLGAVEPEIAPSGGISIGMNGGTRASFQKYAPHLMSFWPDMEDRVALNASFICRRIAGQPVKFSPTYAGKPRVYGFWTHDQVPTPEEQALRDAVHQQCGISIKDYGYGESHPEQLVKMMTDGVTSIIFQEDNGSAEFATNYAKSIGYFPEWIIPGVNEIRAINTNFYGRIPDQTEWRDAVGVTFDYRRDAPHDQFWYRAYRASCTQCPEPTVTYGTAAPTDYDTLQLLFTALQLGGPRLTAATVDRGMHAIPELGSPGPYRPAAYFAPGNYTYVKDATAIFWDPTGTPPGESTKGCYRLVEGGDRYRAGDWPKGDADIGRSGEPCQGDTFNGG